jgi:hypothetical protein
MNAAGLRLLALALGLALAAAPRPAGAQPRKNSPAAQARKPHITAASAADREAARAFAERGYEMFEQGHYQKSIDSFLEAEDRFHAPTHWLYIARSLDMLGKLLDAKEAYDHLLAETLPADAPAPFREAQESGRKEAVDLEARIPSILVALSGAAAAEAQVTLDGVAMPPGAIGKPQRVNPGSHGVVATAKGLPPIERTVAVQQGAVTRVDIALQPPPPPSHTPALFGFGLGAVGLGVGAVAGVVSLNKVAQLQQACPLHQCSPTEQPVANTAKALGTVSTIGFIVGGAGVTAGVVLLAVRASDTQESGAAASARRLRVGIGPGSVAMWGEF